jgi:signal peptidase II
MPLMLFVCVCVVVLDQLAKKIISSRLSEGAFTSSSVCGVRFHHVVNRRSPWNSTAAVRVMAMGWLLLGAAAFAVATRVQSPSTFIALGALFGGAMGNLIDGLSRKGVTDFIDLRVWPVFNLADTAIVAGATVLIWNAVRLRSGG